MAELDCGSITPFEPFPFNVGSVSAKANKKISISAVHSRPGPSPLVDEQMVERYKTLVFKALLTRSMTLREAMYKIDQSVS